MATGSFVGGGAYLEVDASDLQRQIAFLRGILSREQFEKLIYRTFNEVGQRSKTIISKRVPRNYWVNKKWVSGQIEHFKLEHGAMGGVTCTIPLKGAKGTIGGRFSATGGYGGQRIRARIVRGQTTALPTVMKNQGGNPPFINPRSKKLNGVAFTRRTAEKLPIVRVVGLGVPQMPLNQSSEEVRNDILELAWKRLEHNFDFMLGRGR